MLEESQERVFKKLHECCICISTITDDFSVTKCGHTFHGKCLKDWFKKTKICPSCRTNIKAKDIFNIPGDLAELKENKILNAQYQSNTQQNILLNAKLKKNEKEKEELKDQAARLEAEKDKIAEQLKEANAKVKDIEDKSKQDIPEGLQSMEKFPPMKLKVEKVYDKLYEKFTASAHFKKDDSKNSKAGPLYDSEKKHVYQGQY